MSTYFSKTIRAQEVLSAREMDVALLARTAAGRNAICQMLGISANSVKTIFKRIENKLGVGWKNNPDIVWPQYQEQTEIEQAAACETEEADFENGYYHLLEKELKRQQDGRGISLRLLISQSRPGKDVLHVSSSQRFWLRPVLQELEDQKTIKLLAVDWNETFSPLWLPLVYRGRREIRAADYVTYFSQYVTRFIADYLEDNLHQYIGELDAKLRKFSQAARGEQSQKLPDWRQLLLLALREFSFGNGS